MTGGGLTREQSLWRWRILISTYIGYAGYYLTRKVFTIAKTSIADDLGWELADTAYIWGAFLIAYMIGQFVNSFVGRKWGPRVILLWGLGISMACNLVFGITNSFWTFMVFMAVNGLVQATGWPGCVGGVSQWLRAHERGMFMGVWSTSYLVGNIVVKGAGGWLLGAYGWRWSFAGCTLLTIAVWWLLYWWQRDKPEDAGLPPIVERPSEDGRAIRAAQEDTVTVGQYFEIALNPLVWVMGCSYFCIKFLRYALDSWLPAFLHVQGMDVAQASYYSSIFDYAGLAGAIAAGWLLDKYFRGNWAVLCLLMGMGGVAGYLAVAYLGASPVMLAFCYGVIGFMVYGPDTLLCGAASIAVAGEKNGVAVAGLVNGIGSLGPVVQELVIGELVRGDVHAGIETTNRLTLFISVLFVALMAVVVWRLHAAHRNNAHRDAASQ